MRTFGFKIEIAIANVKFQLHTNISVFANRNRRYKVVL